MIPLPSLPPDDTPKIAALFAAPQGVAKGVVPNVVTVPPGDYHLSGAAPLELPSGTTVFAYGARFHFPEKLGEGERRVLFTARNLRDFSWFGGHFTGRCFNHRQPGGWQSNTWAPNTNTRVFAITTAPDGRTENLTFRDVTAQGVAGAVINVEGALKAGSESEVTTFAHNITVENCTLLESGKFMWDYGLLWQILVWPEDYTPADAEMARRYFRSEVIRDGVLFADGDDRVRFDNSAKALALSRSNHPREALCFYGGALPRNIVRGKQYFVVESAPDFIRVSDTPGGAPLRFAGEGRARLMHNLQAAFYELYAPTGSGPGKGGVDLVGCRNVRVSGCKLSALGDTMHIQRCHNVVFANNQIIGSRMGAFFLAEYCKNSTITGNTVDGTNGSRVMSVEKSCEDTTIIGNTFRGGGRGSWINQPKNLVMQGNVFINNTTKGEADPWRGRRSFVTGEWERYAEMYFTTHEANGRYGPVILRDNIFVTGPQAKAALEFQAGGSDILVDGNVLRGATSSITKQDGTTVTIGRNIGVSLTP